MKIAAGVLLVLLLGLVYHLQQIPEPLSEIPLAEFKAPSDPYRNPAPDFQWQDGNGHSKSLKDYAGKVVILVVWAHWCAPCLKEIPTLQQLYARLADPELEIIGVNADTDETEKKSALDFWQSEGISFGIGFLSKSSSRPEQVPTTFIIDRDGQAVFESQKALDWTSPAAEMFLRRLISSHEESDTDIEGDTPDTE